MTSYFERLAAARDIQEYRAVIDEARAKTASVLAELAPNAEIKPGVRASAGRSADLYLRFGSGYERPCYIVRSLSSAGELRSLLSPVPHGAGVIVIALRAQAQDFGRCEELISAGRERAHLVTTLETLETLAQGGDLGRLLERGAGVLRRSDASGIAALQLSSEETLARLDSMLGSFGLEPVLG